MPQFNDGKLKLHQGWILNFHPLPLPVFFKRSGPLPLVQSPWSTWEAASRSWNAQQDLSQIALFSGRTTRKALWYCLFIWVSKCIIHLHSVRGEAESSQPLLWFGLILFVFVSLFCCTCSIDCVCPPSEIHGFIYSVYLFGKRLASAGFWSRDLVSGPCRQPEQPCRATPALSVSVK